MVAKLLFLLAFGATGMGQFVFQHGLHPHVPHPPPPAHPVGSPQFPRFTKCMKSDAVTDDTEGKQWEWWQREYGCASLFASIGVLAHSTSTTPTTSSPHSTTPTTSSSTKEPVTDSASKKVSPEANQHEVHHAEKSIGHQLPRYRSHRAGGLFAGVGLTSDFYAGGFGRYSRIAAAAQQDPFAWRHASPNDIRTMTIELPQRDALDDMTSERRRRDTQTCAEFRILAAKVVTSGSLESVCCNIICYCDEIQNITATEDRCGSYDGPISHVSTQRPSASSSSTVRPSAASVIDGIHGRHTVIISVTEHELNNTAENGTSANGSSSGHNGQFMNKLTTESSTSASQQPKVSTVSTTTDHSHGVSSSSTTFPNDPALLSSVKKVHEVLSGGLANEKARRPIWTPIMANGDNVYHSSTHRKSYQFGAPEEWGNFVQGDSSVRNSQGVKQKN